MTENPWKTIKDKDAYGRKPQYRTHEGKCDICGHIKTVLESDCSEGEYASFDICKQCFLLEIEKHMTGDELKAVNYHNKLK